jgi:NADPH2:quinone reductase
MIGVTFRTRTSEERFQVVRRFTNEVLPLLSAGSVVPMIDRSFALPEVEEAEAYMKTSTGIGKILIDVA